MGRKKRKEKTVEGEKRRRRPRKKVEGRREKTTKQGDEKQKEV